MKGTLFRSRTSLKRQKLRMEKTSPKGETSLMKNHQRNVEID
jgi:hypothetical protein